MLDLTTAQLQLRQSAQEYTALDIFAYTLLVLVVSVCVTTRISTAASDALRKQGELRLVPYWIPYVGHVLSMAFMRRRLYQKARDAVGESGFRLVLFGKEVNVLTSFKLVNELKDVERSEASKNTLSHWAPNLFGTSGSKGAEDGPDMLSESSWLSQMSTTQAQTFCDAVVNAVQQRMPDLVSFLPSQVDQQLWERRCNEDAEFGTETASVDLYALIRDFVGVILTTKLMGSSFVGAYEVVLDDIWGFNKNFDAIALGIPRQFPLPRLIPSYKARKRLLEGLIIFHKAFRKIEEGGDPGFDWRDLDDVSDFMRERAMQYMKAGVDCEVAAREDLAILWAMNTQISANVFWQIMHILVNDEVYDKVMKEVAPFAKAYRPDSAFKIAEPVRVTLDSARLANCSFLRATYYETLRLMSTQAIIRKAKADFSLQTAANGGKKSNVSITKGSYVAVFLDLNNTVEGTVGSPTSFLPRRFLPEESDNADDKDLCIYETWSKFNPFAQSDKTARHAEQISLAFVAAFLVAWDIEGAKGPLQMPQAVNSPLMKIPKKDVRVLIESKH